MSTRDRWNCHDITINHEGRLIENEIDSQNEKNGNRGASRLNTHAKKILKEIIILLHHTSEQYVPQRLTDSRRLSR